MEFKVSVQLFEDVRGHSQRMSEPRGEGGLENQDKLGQGERVFLAIWMSEI
jgi:hypothetical protein